MESDARRTQRGRGRLRAFTTGPRRTRPDRDDLPRVQAIACPRAEAGTFEPGRMRDKITSVLHSQDGFGADSTISRHLMRHPRPNRFVVHLRAAGGWLERSAVARQFREIPDIRLHHVLCPGFRHRSLGRFCDSSGLRPFPLDLMRLRSYVLRERIQLIHSTDRPRDALCRDLAKLTGAKSVLHSRPRASSQYSALPPMSGAARMRY